MKLNYLYLLIILSFFSINEFQYAQDLIINEIHADPHSTEGDANGDGVVSSDDDEFVELINNSGASLDISSWTLSDGIGVKHTFPASTIIPAGETIVVFGGGTPTNIPGIVQTTTTLGLNNTGDDVTVRDDLGVVVDSYTYGSEGGDDQSLARSPDISGTFVKHTTIVTNSVRYSPGRDNTDNSALPVELTSFSVEFVNNSIQLNWETATETNNAGFEVQRQNSEPVPSEDEGWEVLTFIPGHGTTNSPKYYSYIDSDLPKADKVSYRLRQIDNDGTDAYSKTVEVELGGVTSVEDEVQFTFALEQNYPNPFNPVTTINFTLPSVGTTHELSQQAKLTVYNLLGQEVRTLVNEAKLAGSYQIQFDASDLPSGIYFYSLTYGNHIQTRKLALLK